MDSSALVGRVYRVPGDVSLSKPWRRGVLDTVHGNAPLNLERGIVDRIFDRLVLRPVLVLAANLETFEHRAGFATQNS